VARYSEATRPLLEDSVDSGQITPAVHLSEVQLSQRSAHLTRRAAVGCLEAIRRRQEDLGVVVDLAVIQTQAAGSEVILVEVSNIQTQQEEARWRIGLASCRALQCGFHETNAFYEAARTDSLLRIFHAYP
jgi:hypothetical protein